MNNYYDRDRYDELRESYVIRLLKSPVFQKVAVLVIGLTLVFIGTLLLVLPGPGILVILAGLVVLSSKFKWAQGLRDKAQRKASDQMRKTVERARQRQQDRGYSSQQQGQSYPPPNQRFDHQMPEPSPYEEEPPDNR